MSYLLIAALLGGLILIHELGHFFAARAMGVAVRRLSIGFGPRLLTVERGGIEYALSAIPLGGYVMLDIESEDDYRAIPLAKRVIFSIAGPFANVVVAVACFAALNIVNDGWSLQALLHAPGQTLSMTGKILASLPALFDRPDALSGVIGIVAQGSEVIAGSAVRALQFAILITLNLAIFNMLPIPVLDGGKIMFDVLERIAPRVARLRGVVTVASMIGLLALFAYASVLDVARIFS